MIVLLLLPVAGLIIYLIFGRDTRDVRDISKHAYDRINSEHAQSTHITLATDLPDLGHHNLLHDLLLKSVPWELPDASAEIATFTTGLSKLESLIADILDAKHYIHIQYYRFLDDKTGVKARPRFWPKAQRGSESAASL